MIIKISSGLKQFNGIVNYHEIKVCDDKAKLVCTSFGIRDKVGIIDYLTSVGEKNKHVQNKGHDISINFNHKDVVSEQQVLVIAYDYLVEMGFENNPYVIYKHNDKLHQHYHIVVSNVDELGKHNEKMRSFYIKDSIKIARDFEIKYNLTPTNYTKNQKFENLKALNLEKFNIQNAILKGLKDPTKNKFITHKISDIQELIMKEKLNNSHLEVLLGSEYKEMKQYLHDNNLLETSLKSQLIEHLDHSLLNSNNMDEFSNVTEKKGLYIRHVKGGKGFVFGINNPKEENIYYFNEKSLPERFRVVSFVKEENKIEHSPVQQKSFLKNNVNMALKKNKTLPDFIKYLNSRNIEVIFNENKAGIQGVSFVSKNIKNPIQFKASELDRSLSWNNISTNFYPTKTQDLSFTPSLENNSSNAIDTNTYLSDVKVETPENVPNNINQGVDLSALHRLKKHDNDDEEDYKRKKKRNQKGR